MSAAFHRIRKGNSSAISSSSTGVIRSNIRKICYVRSSARLCASRYSNAVPPVILCAVEGVYQMLPHTCSHSAVDR